jgi:8-oxo-dGTP pyrophosphatase MutT (NUDIX family)
MDDGDCVERDPKDTNESVVVVVIKDNKVLIVQRSKTDYWMPLHWSLPGGHIMIGETPYHAAKRELQEEVSLVAKTISYVGTRKSYDNHKMYVYACDDFGGDVKLNFEHSDYKWVSIDEVDDYKCTPKLKQIIADALQIPLGYY